MTSLELRPGVLTDLFARAAAVAQARTGAALSATAAAVAHQAVTNASVGRHEYRTPTPASPGTGPAIISGTLTGSIAFSPATPIGIAWSARVGARAGMFPAYLGRRGKTPSSRYGYYLETGLRNGATYPWLVPAGHIARVAGPVVFQRSFALPWL